MRPLSTAELRRYSWLQLLTLIDAIEAELPSLPENSEARRNALITLYTVRRVLILRDL